MRKDGFTAGCRGGVPGAAREGTTRIDRALPVDQQGTGKPLLGVLLIRQAADALGLGGAFGLAITAGALAFFAPGGIGVREMSMAGLATLWLPMPQALALAALLRLLAVVLDIAAGVSARKKPTSLPSCEARSMSVARSSFRFQTRLRAASVAAASLEPPASPAAAGMRLISTISARRSTPA